jgi:hypothetical protein
MALIRLSPGVYRDSTTGKLVRQGGTPPAGQGQGAAPAQQAPNDPMLDQAVMRMGKMHTLPGQAPVSFAPWQPNPGAIGSGVASMPMDQGRDYGRFTDLVNRGANQFPGQAGQGTAIASQVGTQGFQQFPQSGPPFAASWPSAPGTSSPNAVAARKVAARVQNYPQQIGTNVANQLLRRY